jgi:uncharacterized protein (DUF1778 family)
MARKPKGEAARTETLAIRLDPRTRYMLELASRIQHRTLSSVVEWMINNSQKDIEIDEHRSLASVQANLWDIDEPDRLVKLATQYPHLLNYEEQKIWKVIVEHRFFWMDGNRDEVGAVIPRIRENWELIKGVASGEVPTEHLPSYQD